MPIHQPRAAAAQHTIVVPTTFAAAMPLAPSSASRFDSQANELNVVREPQNPMPRRVTRELVVPQLLTRNPSSNDPATLTANVPHGKTASHRRCT